MRRKNPKMAQATEPTALMETVEAADRWQPIIRSDLNRFVYETERTDEGVTAFAGLPVQMEAFHALGLADACEEHVQLKQRDRGPTDAQWVEGIVTLHLAGGETLEDLNALKQDEGLRRLCPTLGEMSPRSMLEYLTRFDDPSQPEAVQGAAVIREETAGLKALGRVCEHLIGVMQENHPCDTATVDIPRALGSALRDASIHECDKRTALYTYEHCRGYQPVVAFWVEQKMILMDQFRDGNVPAGMGNEDIVKEVFRILRGLSKPPSKIRIRGDTALYDHKVMRFIDSEGGEFAISADMTPQLRAAIEADTSDTWKPLDNRDGSPGEPGRVWKEVVYVPDEPGEKKGLKPFRYLVIRLPLKPAQVDLFNPEANKPDYLAVVTNREGPGDAIIHWHREKCGTIEHVHDQKKNDVGNRLFPSSRFGANAAWYRLGSLALNLHQAVLTLGMDKQWQDKRLPTMRLNVWNRAGRVTKHAGGLVILVSKMAESVLDIYLRLRQALAKLSESARAAARKAAAVSGAGSTAGSGRSGRPRRSRTRAAASGPPEYAAVLG